MLSISVNFGNFVANERIFSYGLEKIKKKINSPRDLISMLSLSISMELLKFRGFRFFSRDLSFVRTRKDKEKDKFYSRFNFDAFPFDFDFGNFVARLSSIFLGIYRSTEKIKKKINSPRDLISMLFDLDGTFEISLRGFRFFSRNLLLVKKKIDILTLGMLSFVHTPSWSKRSLISHAKMEGHSLL